MYTCTCTCIIDLGKISENNFYPNTVHTILSINATNSIHATLFLLPS